jgi:KDO2-lipid IV(A) lauroyltransferase
MAALRTTVGRRLKSAGNSILGWLAVAILKAIRLIGPDATSNIGGWVMRRIGPMLREHGIGRANLKAAFPEKSDAEIERILRDVWDNLGRVGAEFAHIDRLWDYDETASQHGRIMDLAEEVARARKSRTTGKPMLCFSAHLANWEMSAVAARQLGIETAVLYRPPNLAAVAAVVVEMRKSCMGPLVASGLSAPRQLADVLEAGGNVAMLVDQYAVGGVPVTFFGRPTQANPLIARLARLYDCNIHGMRTIRQPGNRFSLNFTEAIPPVRDAEGKVDVQGTMQAITDVVEGWVREHPEQWLWLHRRWRGT